MSTLRHPIYDEDSQFLREQIRRFCDHEIEPHGEAWEAAGSTMGEGYENLASAREDIFYKPYDREGSPEEAMQQYLTWEIALVEQIKRDGTLVFPHFDPS